MTPQIWIHKVIDAFYAKARNDVLIGYHFRVIEDFDEHIPRIVAFWEIQLLGQTQIVTSGPFDILGVHGPLKIKRGELGRWLLLFRQTLAEISGPETQELKIKWEEKLVFFEKTFLRFFGL
jgi:truncated hemoglobin YjbI